MPNFIPIQSETMENQSINQSLYVSGNKNPYYLRLKESKIERKNIYKHADAKKPQTHSQRNRSATHMEQFQRF